MQLVPSLCGYYLSLACWPTLYHVLPLLLYNKIIRAIVISFCLDFTKAMPNYGTVKKKV